MSEDASEDNIDASNAKAVPREVKLVKGSHGFGFNIRGQVSEGGQLKSIGGVLYAPMQYISAVLEGGPADEAHIRVGDRVLEVNGVAVEGADHHTVVQLIKKSGNTVRLSILSVTDEERAKLEVESTPTPSSVEYYERRSVPLAIPSSEKKTESGKEYVVFNIHLAGKLIAQRRYREFDALHGNLKRQFPDFLFPRLPGKWPFTLSDAQVDSRRRGLEDYMEKVCGIKVIFESDLIQDFLCVPQLGSQNSQTAPGVAALPKAYEEPKADVTIQLPGGKTFKVFVARESQTPQVYEAVLRELGLSESSKPYFALFKVSNDGFINKLGFREFPASQSPLLFRKWIFSTVHEADVTQGDTVAQEIIYQQAVEDVRENRINVETHLRELKSLQLQEKKDEYLKLMRSLESYNCVMFPHCSCDARKDGHIRLVVSLSELKLQACDADGNSQDQEHSFPWDMVRDCEADLEEEAFIFRYNREGKSPKLVRIFSEHFLYMEESVSRAIEESHWPLPASAKRKTRSAPVASASNHVTSYVPDDDDL